MMHWACWSAFAELATSSAKTLSGPASPPSFGGAAARLAGRAMVVVKMTAIRT